MQDPSKTRNSATKCRNTNVAKPLIRRTVKYPPKSDFVAIDCEMVGVGKRGRLSLAARATVIDWYGNVLLDEHIIPSEQVVDYRTSISGIKEKDLQDANITLEDCREKVVKLIANKILVGHSLKNDLKALGIQHPWWLIRDTAKYAPFMRERREDGVLSPRKLKDLVRERLHREIQVADQPHSPYEDALASLDLYKTVRQEWEKVMCYKMEKTQQIQQKQQQQLATQ
eukprot:scaffold6638_cov127-Cylindrotheca_fusiformis.AAC.38